MLERIAEKNLLINIFSQKFKIFVIGLAQFQNRHLDVKTELFDKLILKLVGNRLRKNLTDGIQVKRNRYFLPVDFSFDFVHIRMPSGKTAQIFPHMLQIGVENMRTVFMDTDVVLVIIVVRIAADMVFGVNNQNFLAEILGNFPSHRRSGKTAADNQIFYVMHPEPSIFSYPDPKPSKFCASASCFYTFAIPFRPLPRTKAAAP